jgi:hypothetical protein
MLQCKYLLQSMDIVMVFLKTSFLRQTNAFVIACRAINMWLYHECSVIARHTWILQMYKYWANNNALIVVV